MKKFRVYATVTVTCSRVVDAEDEADAIEQSAYIQANEWREGFTVESEFAEVEHAHPVKE